MHTSKKYQNILLEACFYLDLFGCFMLLHCQLFFEGLWAMRFFKGDMRDLATYHPPPEKLGSGERIAAIGTSAPARVGWQIMSNSS